MGRSARLAIGTIAAAVAAERIGTNQLGAAVALAMAALLVFGELAPGRGTRRFWPVVVGAGVIAVRLAILPPGPATLQYPPEGDGPWSLVALATGAPREGHQAATLGTPSGVVPAFVVAATLPRYPAIVPGDTSVWAASSGHVPTRRTASTWSGSVPWAR